MKNIWIDDETFGPMNFIDDRIIELAALYEDTSKDYKTHGKMAKDVLHVYCKPFDEKPENWDEPLKGRKENITELTGITWEFLEANGVSDNELYRAFNDFVDDKIDQFNKTDKAIFAAFNAKFDNQMLRALFTRNKDNYFGSYFLSANLDVMSIVAFAIMEGVMPPLVNHQLDTVCKELNIEVKHAHSAIDDITRTRKAHHELRKRLMEKWRKQR